MTFKYPKGKTRMARHQARLSAAKDEQLKFRMAADLRDRLEVAAKQSGRTLSEEIRQRLDASFADSPPPTGDETTGGLLAAISELAGIMREVGHEWHEDPWTFPVFKSVVDRLLDGLRPEGQQVSIDEAIQNSAMTTAELALMSLSKSPALYRRWQERMRKDLGTRLSPNPPDED